MNITGLLHNAVRNFRGPEPEDSNGAAGLSVYMGITAVSLSHKVSPTYPSAHCSPEEIVAICQLTRDHAPCRLWPRPWGTCCCRWCRPMPRWTPSTWPR